MCQERYTDSCLLSASFIKGFSKKPYRTADQIKLVFDFLDFISLRMRECEVWATLSEKDFENATEAMEKLVMNRLYSYTFTPAVAREARWAVQTDDLERDHVLKQRVRLFGWIGEQHLDVPRGEHSRGFVEFAMQGEYRTPRAKRRRGMRMRPVGLTADYAPALRRTTQDQPLQGPARQAHLYLELLQSHLRYVSTR